MSAETSAEPMTPQEAAALILRLELDAATLLRRAAREQASGAVAILVSLEEVRELAARMTAVAALKEREHLALYGAASVGGPANGVRRG